MQTTPKAASYYNQSQQPAPETAKEDYNALTSINYEQQVFTSQRRRAYRGIGSAGHHPPLREDSHEGLRKRVRRRAVRRRHDRQSDPHVQRNPLLERSLRRVAAVRPGYHDGTYASGSLPRAGEASQGGPHLVPQRGRLQPRRVLPDQVDRAAEPQLPHPRGVPQPYRHPARERPYPRRHGDERPHLGVLRLVRPRRAQNRPDDYRRGRGRADRLQRAWLLCQAAHASGTAHPQLA